MTHDPQIESINLKKLTTPSQQTSTLQQFKVMFRKASGFDSDLGYGFAVCLLSSNRYLIMRSLLALLLLVALPLSAHAQAGLEGAWTLTFMMEEGASTAMPVHAEVVQDTLHMTIPSDHGDRALEAVSFNNDVLNFVLPTGHGSVTCVLYREEGTDNFSGICEGQMGEIPTTMTRKE